MDSFGIEISKTIVLLKTNNPPTLLKSIITYKCPRCRKGKMFPFSVLNPFKFSVTNDYCPHCNLKFEHETGFFWTSMYISYGFSTGLMILMGVISINLNWSFSKIMYVLIPTILLLTPFLFRYSRVLLVYWLHPFKKFDKNLY